MATEKTYSLNKILDDVYEKDKNNLDKKRKNYKQKSANEEYEECTTYQNFIREKTRDLKKICNTLGINLNDFQGVNGYNIPEFVKDIIEEYLSIEGTKGGFISKLRNGKIENITALEKKDFILGLKKRIDANKEYTKDRKELIEKLMDMNLYNVKFLTFMDAKQALIVNHSIETIHNDITRLRNKNNIDGLIRFKNAEKSEMKIDKKVDEIKENNVLGKVFKSTSVQQISESQFNNRTFLEDSDIDVLVDIYEELINQASEKWNQIVNYFEDVKYQCIEKEVISKATSQTILRQVLKEIGGFEKMFYKEDLLNSKEDLEEIINSIKND